MGNVCTCCGSKGGPYKPVDPGITSLASAQIPQGCRVNVLKQDPSVHQIRERTVWLPADLESGPSTSDIMVRMNAIIVKPTNAENDFLYELHKNPEEFDIVNSFATVFQVLNMYRRALKRLSVTKPLEWQWGSTPIRVYPRFGEDKNAFYHRGYKALCFYYFKDPNNAGEIIYTCRSYDIVSHETGHAILDALKPDYLLSKKPQCGALHEAFGDLTAIFSLLNQLDMCEAAIALSKGDLRDRNFLPVIAEEFGTSLGIGIGLRNADNDLTLDDVSDEVHDLSRVFTGAVYDILVSMYEICRNTATDDPAETLYRVGEDLSSIFIIAIINSPNADATFSGVATEMMKATKESAFKTIMQKEFDKRKFFDKKASANVVEAKITDSLVKNCCGTMTLQHSEAWTESVKKIFEADLKLYGDFPEPPPPPRKDVKRKGRKTSAADERAMASRSILETDSMKWIDATPGSSIQGSREELQTNNTHATKGSKPTKKEAKKEADKKDLLVED